MNCKKCSQVAVVNMRHHRLALCQEHFLEWVPRQAQRAIERYEMFGPQDRIMVAVSGGKDSLSLWDVLLRLGYEAEGLHIDLGISKGGYSLVSKEKAEGFAKERSVPLQVVDLKERYGKSVPQLAAGRRGQTFCSLCGLVKRYIMNREAAEKGAVLATGHNLDDEVAVLFQNVLHWQDGYLARQEPVLPSTHPRPARKVKPFFRLYERETAAYAILRGIDYIYDECPYAIGSTTIFYKELFNRLEANSRGAKLQFYLSFLQAKEEGLFSQVRAELSECARCGLPTSAAALCAFCRLWEPQVAESR